MGCLYMLVLGQSKTGGTKNQMTNNNLYRTKAVAERAGISKETLLRWMKERKVKEPGRDRNGWRIFTEEDVVAIVEYANVVSPSPHDLQKSINFK